MEPTQEWERLDDYLYANYAHSPNWMLSEEKAV